MRSDYSIIQDSFEGAKQFREQILSKLQENLLRIFESVLHIDRITCRLKSVESFMAKAGKNADDGKVKYNHPIKEIQDQIGARVIVYYKSDLEAAKAVIENFFDFVEKR